MAPPTGGVYNKDLLFKINTYLNKKTNKMSDANIERKKLTLAQTIKQLKINAKQGQLTREDELDIDYSDEIEFILGLKGWRLLCHIAKEYPYTIRFRLIGSRDYKRVKPNKFIEIAKQTLLH